MTKKLVLGLLPHLLPTQLSFLKIPPLSMKKIKEKVWGNAPGIEPPTPKVPRQLPNTSHQGIPPPLYLPLSENGETPAQVDTVKGNSKTPPTGEPRPNL